MRAIAYSLRLADDLGHGGGGLREDGGCVDAVEANVGGDIKARHLLFLLLLQLLFLRLSLPLQPLIR